MPSMVLQYLSRSFWHSAHVPQESIGIDGNPFADFDIEDADSLRPRQRVHVPSRRVVHNRTHPHGVRREVGSTDTAEVHLDEYISGSERGNRFFVKA